MTWEFACVAMAGGALAAMGATLMGWVLKRVADALKELREELAEWRKGRE